VSFPTPSARPNSPPPGILYPPFLGDKAQRFADDAEDFAATARKLRQQQQKNSGFFGFF
jgi:hypothetical protein